MKAKYLFRAAAASYVTNCALGAAVATRRLDTSRYRWVHHAVFIATVALAVAAESSALWGRLPASAGSRGRHGTPRGRRTSIRPALVLAPAAIPFAIIPRIGAKSPRHIAVALSAAPFVLGGAVLAGR